MPPEQITLGQAIVAAHHAGDVKERTRLMAYAHSHATMRELAALLGVSLNTVWRWVHSGASVGVGALDRPAVAHTGAAANAASEEPVASAIAMVERRLQELPAGVFSAGETELRSRIIAAVGFAPLSHRRALTAAALAVLLAVAVDDAETVRVETGEDSV